MIIKPAERTLEVHEYYFSAKLKEVASISDSRISKGLFPIINMGIGSPDGMPPMSAIDKLRDIASKKDVHAYQSYTGTPQLREAFASWYQRFYGVDLDPSSQIQPLTGSKEGIMLISLAFLNPGDKVLIPDPGYPTYVSASKMVGAIPVPYDLLEVNDWKPDFEALEDMNLEGVKMMWTNYPNMPTGGKADMELYERLIAFGKKHGIMICNDNPYSFILNDKPLSILNVDGAMDCALELNSLSKAHNMSGWRIGMVAASAQVISVILKVKSQMDSGIFRPLQLAAVEALSQGKQWYESLNEEYAIRKEAASKLFQIIGANYDKDCAGLFLWGRLDETNPLAQGAMPDGSIPIEKDMKKTLGERVSDSLLYIYGIFVAPGFIFGKNGNDYIRISLCLPSRVYMEAADLLSLKQL